MDFSINPQQAKTYLCWLYAVTTMLIYAQKQALTCLESKLVGMRKEEMKKLFGRKENEEIYHHRLRSEIQFLVEIFIHYIIFWKTFSTLDPVCSYSTYN